MSFMSPSTRTVSSSLRYLTTKKLPHKRPFSTRIPLPRTPHPHQYDLILSHPTFPNPPQITAPRSTFSDSEPSFEDWVDKKLAHPSKNVHVPGMDKNKRAYYNRRRKALYGEDSDDEMEKRMKKSEVVELVPEVIEFKSLHEKEEELYFYDSLIVPWEKDKHYRMVYQLEKKFFPGQGMDNAFLPGEKWGTNAKAKAKAKAKDKDNVIDKRNDKAEDKDKDKDDKLVFFGEKDKEGMTVDLSLKKVGEFFKGLRKAYNNSNNNNKKDVKAVEGLDEGLGMGMGLDEPFLATRTTGLPVRWDSPGGTVVLVNKPKGWTSFTVCGKLRRLTKVKKVGHAGTLDPMATGLLIVCVGRATKIVDSYQGMVKSYSGTFRLGEATSTWDADSPVIQREPWEHIKDSDIKKAVASFKGEIWQVPPMFSAIKVGGEKMYDKARRGESIELSPRRISILKFDVERSLEDRQNLIFRVTCSKGTYIRSLCADLGKALGSCAHLTALYRDSIGDYFADDAFNFEELETLVTKKYV